MSLRHDELSNTSLGLLVACAPPESAAFIWKPYDTTPASPTVKPPFGARDSPKSDFTIGAHYTPASPQKKFKTLVRHCSPTKATVGANRPSLHEEATSPAAHRRTHKDTGGPSDPSAQQAVLLAQLAAHRQRKLEWEQDILRGREAAKLAGEILHVYPAPANANATVAAKNKRPAMWSVHHVAAGYLEAFDQFLRADGYDDGERVVTLTDTHSRLYHQGGPAKVSIIEMATQEFLGNVAFLLPDTEIDALWGNIAAAEQAEDNRKAWLASQGLVEHRELRLCCGRTSPTTPPGVEGPAVSPKVTSTTTGSSRARSAASSGSLGGEFVFAGSDAELAALLAEGFTLEMLAAQAQMFSTLSGSGNAKAPVAEVVATGGDGADPVLAALVADGVVENLDEAALLFHAIQISMEDAPAPAQPRWEPPAASSAELSTAAAAAGAAAVVVAKQALSAPPTLQAAIGVRKTSESGNKQGLAVLLEDDIESAAAVRSSPPKWRVVHEHEDDEPASVGCLGCFGGLFNGVRRAQKEHSSEAARPKGKSTLLAKLRRGLARCLGRRARQ